MVSLNLRVYFIFPPCCAIVFAASLFEINGSCICETLAFPDINPANFDANCSANSVAILLVIVINEFAKLSFSFDDSIVGSCVTSGTIS